ncbi:hypothetical protein LAJ55_13650, partial [Streptococcus pneumoniae]|uniref:hypothetical protein n=1 Tax=Streptococcus pneumoniae TaxID=1313 RepID=UPI001CBCEF5A
IEEILDVTEILLKALLKKRGLIHNLPEHGLCDFRIGILDQRLDFVVRIYSRRIARHGLLMRHDSRALEPVIKALLGQPGENAT